MTQYFCSIEAFFGSIALITSIIGLLPQVYKSYKTKSTIDVSMAMLINWLVCSASWIIYGMYTSSTFVVWSNIAGTLFAAIAILQKLKYDGNFKKSSRI